SGLLLYAFAAHPHLPSFPTRRSSDLQLRDQEPVVTAVDLDWDVGNLTDSLAELYKSWAVSDNELRLPGLDGALRTIFEGVGGERSEEHTSELQSRFDLVCRLLLEKKK